MAESFGNVLGSIFGGGGGAAAAGSAAATTLSPLIVNSASSGLGGLGGALGSAAGAGAGQALAQGLGGAIGGSSAPTGQAYTTQNPLSGSASTDSLGGNVGSDDLGGPLSAGDPNATNVSGVDVSAPAASANFNFVAPDTSGLFGALTPPPSMANLGLTNVGSAPDQLTPASVLAQPNVTPPSSFSDDLSALSAMVPNFTNPSSGPTQPGSGQDLKNAGLLGLLGLGSGKGAGGLLTSVLPAALLYSALSGAGGGAGANQAATNSTIDSLQGLAGGDSALLPFLTNKAMANLGGNVGGPAMSAIERNVDAAQAAIRQRYSQMGMSGSTAEAQDLQGAAEAGLQTQFKTSQDMATEGLNAISSLTGQSAAIYDEILKAQLQQGTALGNASAAFAGAASQFLGNALGGLFKATPTAKAA